MRLSSTVGAHAQSSVLGARVSLWTEPAGAVWSGPVEGTAHRPLSRHVADPSLFKTEMLCFSPGLRTEMKFMRRKESRRKSLDDDYPKKGTELELRPTLVGCFFVVGLFLMCFWGTLEEGHEDTFERNLGIYTHSHRWRGQDPPLIMHFVFSLISATSLPNISLKIKRISKIALT